MTEPEDPTNPAQPPSFPPPPSGYPPAPESSTPPPAPAYPPPPAQGFPPPPEFPAAPPPAAAYGYGQGAPTDDGAPLMLTVAVDRDRNRLTTFFRAILALPHFIVLYVLNIVVGVVVFLAWLAALFTGRNPEGLRTFTIGVLRWQTRVFAYYYLLTDDYPPFSFEPGGYPVDIEVAPAGKLNRLAVLFRIILMIPAALLAFVVSIVLYVLVIVAWLAGVFAGKVPEGIYGMIAGGLQYMTRYSAYYYLVTPTYPSQPFGPAQLTSSSTKAA